jgi:endoglycosylceramidase
MRKLYREEMQRTNPVPLLLPLLFPQVAPKIRENDDEHLIFYEPVTWGMIFEGKIAGSGFSHVPGGAAYRNRSVFSYHYYCNTFLPSYGTHPKTTKVVCDDVAGPLVMKAVKKDLGELGGAAMMTEGMACGQSAEEECETVMNMLDTHLFSWTDYGESQGDTFLPSPPQQEEWARTYARAVAGMPSNMTYVKHGGTEHICV